MQAIFVYTDQLQPSQKHKYTNQDWYDLLKVEYKHLPAKSIFTHGSAGQKDVYPSDTAIFTSMC